MAREGFAAPMQRLSDEKIASMSSAELKAEAHQRGWPFGDMGARSARVRFYQLQFQYMGPPTAVTPPIKETSVQNARTPEERHKQHMEGKGLAPTETNAQTGTVSPEVTGAEQEALTAMRENEARNSTPGVQPGRDDRTPEQKALIDNNLETKRAAGLTGEPDKTVDPEAHKGEVPAVVSTTDTEKPVATVPPAALNAAGKDAEQPDDKKNVSTDPNDKPLDAPPAGSSVPDPFGSTPPTP